MDNSEQRAHKRFPFKLGKVTRYFVTDPANDKHLYGQMVDLSRNGLRLRTAEPYAIDTVITGRVELPYKHFERTTIDVELVCRWSRPVEKSSEYDSGFEFVDQTEINAIFIERVCSLTPGQRLSMSFMDSKLNL